MSIKANPTVVGAFVIGAIFLTVISILVLGSGRFFKNDMRLMAVFPGSVKGLHIGSPVLFRGVNIGSVVDIKLYHDKHTHLSMVPVYIDLKQEVLELMNHGASDSLLTEEQALSFMGVMIKSGLHARLTLENLVSGRQLVEFELDHDIHIKLTGIDKRYLEVPTVESDFDKLQNFFKTIPLEKLTKSLIVTITEVNELFANKEGIEVLHHLKTTLDESSQLLKNLNEQVIPLSVSAQSRLLEVQLLLQNTDVQLTQTLKELIHLSTNVNNRLTQLTLSATQTFKKGETTLDNMNTLVDKKSTVRHELEISLKELSRAAKSMRIFTEYLERHPEAIIKGKQQY